VGSILLVEADPQTCDRWTTALAEVGHSVLAVLATKEALPLIRDGGIDVVVIDAYDSCAGVIDLARSMEALPDAPPIVLVSGSPAAPEISARIGVAQFLAKPCEPSELIEAIGHLLGALRPVRSFDDEPTGSIRQLG
jgi:CheY-like chemotaxis protein